MYAEGETHFYGIILVPKNGMEGAREISCGEFQQHSIDEQTTVISTMKT